MKKRVPKEFRVSARISAETKSLIDKSGYTPADLITWAAHEITSEKGRVLNQIHFLEQEITEDKLDLITKEMRLEELNKSLIKLDPGSEESASLVKELSIQEAYNRSEVIYSNHGDKSYDLLRNNKMLQRDILQQAKTDGLDGKLLLSKLLGLLKDKCHTSMSDSFDCTGGENV